VLGSNYGILILEANCNDTIQKNCNYKLEKKLKLGPRKLATCATYYLFCPYFLHHISPNHGLYKIRFCPCLSGRGVSCKLSPISCLHEAILTMKLNALTLKIKTPMKRVYGDGRRLWFYRAMKQLLVWILTYCLDTNATNIRCSVIIIFIHPIDELMDKVNSVLFRSFYSNNCCGFSSVRGLRRARRT